MHDSKTEKGITASKKMLGAKIETMDEETLKKTMTETHDYLEKHYATLSETETKKCLEEWYELDKALFEKRGYDTTSETSECSEDTYIHERICPDCKTMELIEGWKYCPNCGKQLEKM